MWPLQKLMLAMNISSTISAVVVQVTHRRHSPSPPLPSPASSPRQHSAIDTGRVAGLTKHHETPAHPHIDNTHISLAGPRCCWLIPYPGKSTGTTLLLLVSLMLSPLLSPPSERLTLCNNKGVLQAYQRP